jgi:hypothetical protein
MVGDYISTSFNDSGKVSTVFAVGLPQPTPSTFDEAMYTPTTLLTVPSIPPPTGVATTGPVLSTGGTGTGALLQSTRRG